MVKDGYFRWGFLPGICHEYDHVTKYGIIPTETVDSLSREPGIWPLVSGVSSRTMVVREVIGTNLP